MAQKVLKPTEVNVNTLKFSDPKKLPNGGNMIYINNGEKPLYVQSPKVNILWDTKYYPDNENSGKYNIQFSLSDMENDTKMKQFHDMIDELDKRVVEIAYDNRKEWFGAKYNKHPKEFIEGIYTPMIKVHMDKETGEPSGKFPPCFGFKIVKRDGVHNCKVYDSDKKLFNIDNSDKEEYKSLGDEVLLKGASMNVLIRCNGIWIINGKFGCTWRAEQVKVKVPEAAISGYAFRDDDDDDMDVCEPKVSQNIDDDMDVCEPKKVGLNIDSDDSDSDDSDDSDDEIVEQEIKKTKKRTVKKQ